MDIKGGLHIIKIRVSPKYQYQTPIQSCNLAGQESRGQQECALSQTIQDLMPSTWGKLMMTKEDKGLFPTNLAWGPPQIPDLPHVNE